MTKRTIQNNNKYDIATHKDSAWLSVTKNKQFLALTMDKQSAYQSIYQDANLDGGCEFLTDLDFERVK